METASNEQNVAQSHVEVSGLVVGNSQMLYQDQSPRMIQGNGEPVMETREYVTVMVQDNPRASFVIDVSGIPSEFLNPGDKVTVRITKD